MLAEQGGQKCYWNACQWEETSPKLSPFLPSAAGNALIDNELRARCEDRYPLQPDFSGYRATFKPIFFRTILQKFYSFRSCRGPVYIFP